MTIVVDASVAFKWYVSEAGTEAALAWLDADLDLAAPDLLFTEVGNALRRAERRGAATNGQVDQAIVHLRGIFARPLPTAELVVEAINLSRRLDHSVYDCLYLAAAEATGAVLVTADGIFQRKAAGGTTVSVLLLGEDDPFELEPHT